MRSKIIKVFTLAAFAAGMVGTAAPAAQASTCHIANPELDYLLCDKVLEPAVATVCRVLTKVPDCVQ